MATPDFVWDSSVNKSVLAFYNSVTGQPVFMDEITGLPTDLIDRAARLLGVVYGSQGQKIKQTATTYNLAIDIAQQSLSKVLATEDNSAAIKTAVEARIATTPTLYNVTMTAANTEYSQALPANTKKIKFRCQDVGFDVRTAYETGKVAAPTSPWSLLAAGEVETVDDLNLTGKTLYFSCVAAGKVMEITCWS